MIHCSNMRKFSSTEFSEKKLESATLSNNVNISTALFHQFSWLMSNEDEHLCKDIARFITSCCDPSFEQFC